MIVNGQNWNDCDCCGKPKTAHYGAVAQGATGRWCVVLSVCDDCLDAQGAREDVVDIVEARERVTGPGSWAEF